MSAFDEVDEPAADLALDEGIEFRGDGADEEEDEDEDDDEEEDALEMPLRRFCAK